MIYLASPYNHKSAAVRQTRYEANVRALAELLNAGEVAFSPIVHHHPVAVLRDLGRGWDFWRRVDVEYLRRCDSLCVLMLNGWKKSVGVKAEIKIADAIGLPVEYLEPETWRLTDDPECLSASRGQNIFHGSAPPVSREVENERHYEQSAEISRA